MRPIEPGALIIDPPAAPLGGSAVLADSPARVTHVLRAYYELTKPGITRMVLVTAAVGFYLGTSGAVDIVLLLHTLIGIALAASGCNALNQVVERDADALMPRTARRPLPSGRLSAQEGLVFATALAILGMLYLLAFVNGLTGALVALVVSSYVFLYTPLKRRTTHATVIGAVPGALPILAGWTAAGGSIDARGLALFAILFLWQMPHFFALAWLYRRDYEAGGFRLLPYGDPHGRRLATQVVTYSVALLAASLAPAALGMTGSLYLAGAAVLGTTFLVLGAALAHRRTTSRARRLFLGSVLYLPALLTLMAFDKLPL